MFALIALGMALGDHDRRHRSFGRRRRGPGQRRGRHALAPSLVGRACRRHRRRARGRRRSTASSSPGCASSPSSPRSPRCWRPTARRCCSPTTSRFRSSYDTGFTIIGQDDFLGFPIPAWIAVSLFILGWISAGAPSGRPPCAGDRRRRGDRQADGPEGRAHAARRLGCCPACWPVWPASSSPRSSAPASRPRAWAGNSSPSPRWWSAARCSPAASGSVGATLAGALLLGHGLQHPQLRKRPRLDLARRPTGNPVIRGLFLLVVVIHSGKTRKGALERSKACLPKVCGDFGTKTCAKINKLE